MILVFELNSGSNHTRDIPIDLNDVTVQSRLFANAHGVSEKIQDDRNANAPLLATHDGSDYTLHSSSGKRETSKIKS